MNKGELVVEVSGAFNVKVGEAKNMVETLSGIYEKTLLAGEEVTLPGIGKLKVSTRPGRVGRNPATGESINIPAKRVIKFSPSAEFETKFSVVPQV